MLLKVELDYICLKYILRRKQVYEPSIILNYYPFTSKKYVTSLCPAQITVQDIKIVRCPGTEKYLFILHDLQDIL